MKQNISFLSIDLAKNVFQVFATDSKKTKLFNKQLKREQLAEFIQNINPCTIFMEACSGSNHWARSFQKLGHIVKIIPPQYVKPFVIHNKSDHADAVAILQAGLSYKVKFTSVKKLEHQQIQTLHGIRQSFVKTRVSIVNEVRGFLSEFGIVMPISVPKFKALVPQILEDGANDLDQRVRYYLRELYNHFLDVSKKINQLEKDLEEFAQSNAVCQAIRRVDGVALSPQL